MTPSHHTLNALDALIDSRSILGHPFYVAWQRNELDRHQLGLYARTYWPHVAAFPAYLESTIAVTTDPTSREVIEENLADERMHPEPHSELWLDFAEAVGVRRREIGSARPHPAAVRIVEIFVSRAARSSTAEGVAALYSYEAQQPDVATQKRDGLRAFYGIDDPRALAYFDVHAETDVAHRDGERTVLRRCLDDGTDPVVLLEAATEALDAYWNLLDGVCDEAGIPRTRGA